MPDRFLPDTTAGEPPPQETVQFLIEAEHGKGAQGIRRTWQASDSNRVVLTSDSTGVKISRDNGTTAPAQVIVDGTAAGGQLSGTYPNPGLSQAVLDLVCPPGAVIAYAASGLPTGWLRCDGNIVLIATYPRLFAVLGTTYGGNGTTTFGLPNLNGRFPLGVTGTHPLASTGGDEASAHTHPQTHGHTHSHVHDMATHTHDLNNHGHGVTDHNHDLQNHSHTTNVDHDHPNLAVTATATTGATGVQNGTGATINVDPQGHTHPVAVNLPALGTTNVASGVPSPNATNTRTGLGTGGPVPAASTGPNLTYTLDTLTPSTSNDSTAGAASYGVSGMPPFLAINYLIRTGS